MDYLVHNTEAEAQTSADLIFERGSNIAMQRGYEVGPDGLVGKDLYGVDRPDRQKTTAWDAPRQRLDGKWVVAHPGSHPAAQNEIAPGVTYLDYVMSGITDPVETEMTDWWPQLEV